MFLRLSLATITCSSVILVISFVVHVGRDWLLLRNYNDLLTPFERQRGRLNRVESPTPLRSPDTTAVILNWSRFANVVQIVETLCAPSLDHVLQTILVWNNNPVELSQNDFVQSRCQNGKLKIVNSPANIYFQARFLACAEATTEYCFIQDDDYLVWPEVLDALHSSLTTLPHLRGIHLLPPHERLSSDLHLIHVDPHIHTSFAWLGHGALVRRSIVQDFLAAMHHLNATEEEIKMADNYYTILGNTYAETWFDQGVELGGGQPFTVGTEGDERNKKHIMRALEYLDSILRSQDAPPKYVETERQILPTVSRSPCFGALCVFQTSISLLPAGINHSGPVSQYWKMESGNLAFLGEDQLHWYLTHAPSNAVDGRKETAFCSPQAGKERDFVSLDLTRNLGRPWDAVRWVFLVDEATELILRSSAFDWSSDNVNWIPSKGLAECVKDKPSLRLCTYIPGDVPEKGRSLRVVLQHGMKEKWCIFDTWFEEA